MSILKTLTDLANASTKISEATPLANITPSASFRNLPVTASQPATTLTAADARARLERRLSAPSTLPATPGTAPQTGGGAVNAPFVCARTRQEFAFQFRQNRYSARLYYQATIKTAPGGTGPAADIQQFQLEDIEWNGARCPHCSADFQNGPVRCGKCRRFTCRGGLNERTNFFACACGHSGFVNGGLDAIPGAKAMATASPALPAGPLLGAGKPAPQLPPPPPKLLKG